MTDPVRPIGEDDLHAYVDGQLDADRRAEVVRHLNGDASAAELVAAYQAQRDMLRATFARAAEPVPQRLDLSRIIEARLRRGRRTPWFAAASVLLALGVGAAGGWLLHAPSVPGRTERAMDLLKQEALASNAVFAADRRHPVEVAGTEAPHLKQWLSNRLDRTVSPPDLSSLGYQFIGGRLLATERGTSAALLMYRDDHGRRLSLLLRPMAPDLHAGPSDMRGHPVNGCAWIDQGLGYAVVGPFSDAELDRVADGIRAAAAQRG
jgi:anti-sigma factor RsiW